MDLVHLRRETRTSLELAIVALAPSDLVERLATASGLLEALVELPPGSPPARTLIPSTTSRARSAVRLFYEWQSKRLTLA